MTTTTKRLSSRCIRAGDTLDLRGAIGLHAPRAAFLALAADQPESRP